jgi:hypothetical protein
MSDKVMPIRRSDAIADAGGPVDEFRVSLAVYGGDLDPTQVSAQIGRPPTTAHRKGDQKRPNSVPHRIGAWILTVEGFVPATPNDGILKLFALVPNDEALWRDLAAKYTVQIRIGIQTAGWNRGFSLSPKSVELISRTSASVELDLYLYGDEDDV